MQHNLAKLMLDIGKSKAKKSDHKLLSEVNKVKQKYNSLEQACRTTFHQNTYIKNAKRKLGYSHKLSEEQV